MSWIDDQPLKEAFQGLLSAVKKGEHQAEHNFHRNVTDPFGVQFSTLLLDKSKEEWARHELHRQIDKALFNAIGNFHQKIIAGIPGWQDLCNTNQFDLINEDKQIIAELKNKHNTLNAHGAANLYKQLSTLVNSKSSVYKGYTAYYVVMIPKSPSGVDAEFCPSDPATGEKCKLDPLVRQMDGKRFYALASGVDSALEDLFLAVPAILKDMKNTSFASFDPAFVLDVFKKAFGS
ncbi:MAG: Eco47II family restriction endonuclease [Lentisphaeria bacterium]|nr:Eco47II family restriction endonuclease [Lentisphaeria bacterium]